MTHLTEGADMLNHEILMCAHPIERALLLDLSTQRDVREMFGQLGDDLRARDAGTSRSTAYLACTRCKGRINLVCVVCGGNGSIRFVPSPDECLDAKPRSGVKGVGR